MGTIWREDMSVGNAKIDNDHKYLISLLNTIEEALNCEVPAQTLLSYVSQLIEYSQKHFTREETYQAELNFPFADAQKKEHKELMAQLIEIHEKFKLHVESDAYRYTTPRLVANLKDWYMDHFIDEDMKMRDFFDEL